MEEFFNHVQDVLGLPAFLINSCTFLPDFIKQAMLESLAFVPWLYFLYYAIELLERFFLKNIHIFVRLIQKLGPIFGAGISVIPESGYQVMVSTFYSRKMITRGTLLSFFIVCSDDALPLLFMDISKAIVIIPIVIIKIIVALAVAYSVDIVEVMFFPDKRVKEDINAINTDLNEPACCNHRIQTIEHPPYWWLHPLTHTFNVFMFVFLTLAAIYCLVIGFGSEEALKTFCLVNSPLQVILAAGFGLISNSVVSIILVIAYLKGFVSFPSLLAGLISVTGLGIATLNRRFENKKEVKIISAILFAVAALTGLFIYYNMAIIDILKEGF